MQQAPKSQEIDIESQQPNTPEAFAAGKHQFSIGRRKLSRQKDSSSDHPEGVVSLKLSEDGLLKQEGTDIEIEVPAPSLRLSYEGLNSLHYAEE